MVVAGIPHPRLDLLDEFLAAEALQSIRGEDGEEGAGTDRAGPGGKVGCVDSDNPDDPLCSNSDLLE